MKKNKNSHGKKSRTIELGEWDTEIEAAQAYNIGALIFNGSNPELNNVPVPSLDTFDNVIALLYNQGWSITDEEMKILKSRLSFKLGMKFLELDCR